MHVLARRHVQQSDCGDSIICTYLIRLLKSMGLIDSLGYHFQKRQYRLSMIIKHIYPDRAKLNAPLRTWVKYWKGDLRSTADQVDANEPGCIREISGFVETVNQSRRGRLARGPVGCSHSSLESLPLRCRVRPKRPGDNGYERPQ
jgi:hypothetical protein